MKCPKCGKEIANESMFCEFCGTKIKRNKVASSTNWLKNKGLWPIYAAVIVIIVLVLLCVSITNKKLEIGNENDYGYVDLGLSVQWATCNVGAYAPHEIGSKYSWGEIYENHNNQYNLIKKYTIGNAEVAKLDKLELSDDVAHVRQGGQWRMPTRVEFKELLANCSVKTTYLNGVAGYKFTSKKKGYKNQWIFLPFNDKYNFVCNYWTSSLSDTHSSRACGYYGHNNKGEIVQKDRDEYCSIRPVCSSNGALGVSGVGSGIPLLILIDALFIIIYSIIYFVKTRKKRQAE